MPLASKKLVRHELSVHERMRGRAGIVSRGNLVLTAPSAHPLIATYSEMREALCRFFRARTGPSGDVDDLLQDLYIKVASLPATTEVRNPRAYLYRLASNLVMDRWRSTRRSAARDGAWRMVSHNTGEVEDLDDAPSAEDVVAGRDRYARLLATLSRLPPKTQAAFRLHKFEGLSYAEVAGRLGMSRSSVEKHMMDALRILAERDRR